jgi:hypothetical protein
VRVTSALAITAPCWHRALKYQRKAANGGGGIRAASIGGNYQATATLARIGGDVA